VQSWTGNVYQPGLVATLAVAVNPIDLAETFMSFAGANASGNGTAVEQNPFTQLDSCSDTSLRPPPSCPGAREAIWNAEKDLTKTLSNECKERVQGYIFDKITQGDTHQAHITTAGFLHYLESKLPQFYDGTKSKAPLLVTCQANAGIAYAVCALGRLGKGNPTIAEYFANNNGGTSDKVVEAVTIGGNDPLIVFFRPSAIETANSGITLNNKAMVFHEALHGMTNLADDQLEEDLLNTHGQPSVIIDQYIINNVFNVCGTL
jgi:hypothetical protein